MSPEPAVEVAVVASLARTTAAQVGAGELAPRDPDRQGEGGLHAAVLLAGVGQPGERLVVEADVMTWVGSWDDVGRVSVAQTAFGVGWRESTTPTRPWVGFLELGARVAGAAVVVDGGVPVVSFGPGGTLRMGLSRSSPVAPLLAVRMGGEVLAWRGRTLTRSVDDGGPTSIDWVPSRAWVAVEAGVSFPVRRTEETVAPAPVPAYDGEGTAGDLPR